MALVVPFGSIPKKILVAACVLASVCWVPTPVALAQHGGHAGGGHSGAGGHFGGGGQIIPPRVSSPRAAAPRPASQPFHAPILRPPVRFRPPIFIRNRVFFRPPFFRFRQTVPPFWWLDCGAFLSWEYGCGGLLPNYGPSAETYVTPIPYEVPVYLYAGPDHELVWLYFKDGTAYGVSDYWFVDDQVHFLTFEEGGAKSVEKVIGRDKLDLQKTVEVNTQRGFRVVMRDEPLEQYLRDHPDPNPPLLQPPPKN
jgi:hypothetical protein